MPGIMNLALRCALAAWVLSLSGFGGWALSRHLPAMPLPDAADPRLGAAVAALSPGDGRPLAMHVIYGECPCSRRVLDAVLSRDADPAIAEALILVGPDPAAAARATARGLTVRVVPPSRLAAEIGVEAAPALVVADADGRVLTVSGYTDRKQGPRIEDRALIAEALAGQARSLPLFGCAVSARLRAWAPDTALARWFGGAA